MTSASIKKTSSPKDRQTIYPVLSKFIFRCRFLCELRSNLTSFYNIGTMKCMLMLLYCEAWWLSGLGCRFPNREVLGSNTTDAISNLGQVSLPHIALVSWDASSGHSLQIYPKRMVV